MTYILFRKGKYMASITKTKLLLGPNQLEIKANASKGSGGGGMFCVIEIMENTNIGPGPTPGNGYVLHLPKEISDIFSIDWSQDELGSDLISRLLQGGFSDAGNSAVSLGLDIWEELGIASGQAKQTRRQTGIYNNIRNTLLFKSSNLRNLQFSWDLIPLNSQMANNYHEFIKDLRSSMYPEGTGATWKSPKLFAISIVVQGKTLLKTERCALTNLTVNPMGSDHAAFHPDGYPVHTVLTMELQEIYALSREAIDQLYT